MNFDHTFVVYVNKRFVSGPLKGHTLLDSVPFISWLCADEYAAWANNHSKEPVKPSGGTSEYIVESAWVEAI